MSLSHKGDIYKLVKPIGSIGNCVRPDKTNEPRTESEEKWTDQRGLLLHKHE